MNEIRKRYIGLDVHKYYLIALGVNEDLEVVLPRCVGCDSIHYFVLSAFFGQYYTSPDKSENYKNHCANPAAKTKGIGSIETDPNAA